MSDFTKTYNILSNASYDSNLIQILGSDFKLKLEEINVDFIEEFNNDTGFVYDNTKVEFIGGLVRQIDKRPVNAVFYAKYYNSINANWCSGSETGTAYNGAAISGNLLDLTGGVSQKYVEYNPTNNIPGAQKGCIRVKNYKPGYSGIPATNQVIYAIGKDLSTKNYISIYHYTNGYIRGTVYDSNGNVLGETLYYWITAIAGNEYEIEFNYDITTGNMYLFVDGSLQGIDTGAIGTRTDDITYMFVGRNYNPSTPNFSIGQILIFDEIQHTTNYTPDWSNIYDTIYLESSVILPEMEHVGDGTIKLFNSLTMIYNGFPRLLLEIGRSGDKLYWFSPSWIVSDETYDQSTNPTTFNTNCGSLAVDGENYGQFTLNFSNSNIQGSVSELTANMKIELYPITNPKISFSETFGSEELKTFLSSFSQSGNDNVTFTITKDGVERYYNSGWSVSNGVYSQSNTLTEIQNNLSTFFGISEQGSNITVNVFLHSENGITTPTFTNVIITYDFVEIDYDEIDTTLIYAFIKDQQTGSKANKIITAAINKSQVKYKNNIIYEREIFSTISRSNGYWELSLPDTENMSDGTKYNFFIDGIKYIRKVPSKDTYPSKIFWELSN